MSAGGVQTSNREELLLDSLRGALEAKNYPWDGPVVFQPGTPSTHSLKELLISSSVDMETTSDTNITALCTIDVEPTESIQCFEKLLKFTEECGSAHKSDISQVLFPIFVTIYLDLVTGGHSNLAMSFHNKYVGVVGPSHKSELKELSDITTLEQTASSNLANKFRNQKYCLRMSSKSFQLLMQFLQVCPTPVLLTLIQRHLAIEVFGSTVLSSGETKAEHKKNTQSPTFTKPKIPQLDENRLQSKRRPPHTDGSGRHTHTAGFTMGIPTEDSGRGKPLQRSSSAASVQPNRLAEFRERLSLSSRFDPSPPSLALYTVDSGHTDVHCASLCPKSKLYACGFADSSIHMWSQLPGATTTTSTTSHVTSYHPIRSQNSTSEDHTILPGHYGAVYGASFSSDGQYLLSASEDCSVRLWNTRQYSCLARYRGHAYPVWDVAFSPVDVYFVSASFDKTARLWSSDFVYPLRIFTGHTSGVDVVKFHPNGKYIATGSCDRTCRLWDIQNGHCVRLMPGSKGAVNCLMFSPSGKQLVSGGEDGTVRVWDLASGDVLKEYQPPPPPPPSTASGSADKGAVTSLSFSPDGTLLASCSHGNQISVWNMKGLVSPNSRPNTVVAPDLISQCAAPEDTTVLQLQFTHRNCLVAIATSSNQDHTDSTADAVQGQVTSNELVPGNYHEYSSSDRERQ